MRQRTIQSQKSKYKPHVPAETKLLSVRHIHPVPVLCGKVISCFVIVSDSKSAAHEKFMHVTFPDGLTWPTGNQTGVL